MTHTAAPIPVNWQALTGISELQPYFAANFDLFQQRIIEQYTPLMAIAPTELDKLALIRVLEVTNGCLQWAFRRQDQQALSVEQTRDCMQVVIGFIKYKKIEYPNGMIISFAPETMALMETARGLYRQAFKQNSEEAKEAFYAHSTAQFLAFGLARIQWAQSEIKTHFTALFSEYFIARGENYIKPYLMALSKDELID